MMRVTDHHRTRTLSTHGGTVLTTAAGDAAATAAALDAADGVIDGKFHGRPILTATTPTPQADFLLAISELSNQSLNQYADRLHMGHGGRRSAGPMSVVGTHVSDAQRTTMLHRALEVNAGGAKKAKKEKKKKHKSKKSKSHKHPHKHDNHHSSTTRVVQGGAHLIPGSINSSTVSRVSRQEEHAALTIQRHYRGFQVRRAPPTKVHHRHHSRSVRTPQSNGHVVNSVVRTSGAPAVAGIPTAIIENHVAKQTGLASPYHAPTITGHTTTRTTTTTGGGLTHTAAGAALDAADGVIDGKYFGQDIKETETYTPTPATVTRVRSTTFTRKTQRVMNEESAALTIQKHYRGFQVRSKPHHHHHHHHKHSHSHHTHHKHEEEEAEENDENDFVRAKSIADAEALDAADGVIDGKCFGTVIKTQDSPETQKTANRTRSRTYHYVPKSSTSTIHNATDQSVTRTAVGQMLDEADGVVDGKYFGRDIVETTVNRGSVLPSTSANIYTQSFVNTTAAPGTLRYEHREHTAACTIQRHYRGFQVRKLAPRVVSTKTRVHTSHVKGDGAATTTTIHPANSTVTTNTARCGGAALDAADGKMDGKHFGRNIVETTVNTSTGGGGANQAAQAAGIKK